MLFLLRGSLYLLITCHTCSPVQGCAAYSDLLNKPQLKCVHAAHRERKGTVLSSSARQAGCKVEPRRSKCQYLIAQVSAAAPRLGTLSFAIAPFLSPVLGMNLGLLARILPGPQHLDKLTS